VEIWRENTISLEDTIAKDSSYFRVIGVDITNGVIDGKYGFRSSLRVLHQLNTKKKVSKSHLG
jgi:hypothetical protein